MLRCSITATIWNRRIRDRPAYKWEPLTKSVMAGQFNGVEWENKLQWIMQATINGNGPKIIIIIIIIIIKTNG
jgi:hypothetical protein